MRWKRNDNNNNDDDDDALGPSNMEVESRGSRAVEPVVVLVPGPAAPSSAT